MRAEIISIGDELTSGERLDTNSQWLSRRLGELGVRTIWHTTVADDLTANVAVFRTALERAEIVVATGGLGPTADDLTRQALADAVGVPLQRDASALQQIAALFARRGREMPERNAVQADFPQGATVIPNPHGTAPGIDLTWNRPHGGAARIFCLPGVPAEMFEMWQATVEPAVRLLVGPTQVIRHRVVKCFGAGESELEAMLPDLIRRGRDPQVGITVHQATITLRITAQADSPAAAIEKMEPTLAVIRQSLGDLIYGDEQDELQQVVLRLLSEQRQTLAVAECGTQGILTRWLGAETDYQQAFAGGTLFNHAESIRQALDNAAQSRPLDLVGQMARRVRDDWRANWGLATGPISGTTVDGIPRIAVALAGPDEVTVRDWPFTGHPEILVPRAGKQALNLLRLRLLGKPA